MICTKKDCGGTIKITHGYRAGPSAQTSTGVCGSCNQKYTIATIVVCEPSGYGTGAAALAKRLKNEGNGVLTKDRK